MITKLILPFLLILALLVAASSASASNKQLNTFLALPNKTVLVNYQNKINTHNLRNHVFAKAGDSNTAGFFNVYGLGCSQVLYDKYAYLASTVKKYRRVTFPANWFSPGSSMDCQTLKDSETVNSFSRYSAATRGFMGWAWLNQKVKTLPYPGTGGWGSADAKCFPEETPLTCELRLMRPKYVMIMMGTNDFLWMTPRQDVNRNAHQVIKTVKQFGSIPVLFTIPPLLPEVYNPEGKESVTWIADLNNRIHRWARAFRVPLVDLNAAFNANDMRNAGLRVEDNIHLSVYDGASANPLVNSVDFSPAALRYGANYRNLLLVNALYTLDKQIERAVKQTRQVARIKLRKLRKQKITRCKQRFKPTKANKPRKLVKLRKACIQKARARVR